jgi:hypothetical protein
VDTGQTWDQTGNGNDPIRCMNQASADFFNTRYDDVGLLKAYAETEFGSSGSGTPLYNYSCFRRTDFDLAETQAKDKKLYTDLADCTEHSGFDASTCVAVQGLHSASVHPHVAVEFKCDRPTFCEWGYTVYNGNDSNLENDLQDGKTYDGGGCPIKGAGQPCYQSADFTDGQDRQVHRDRRMLMTCSLFSSGGSRGLGAAAAAGW